MSDTDKLIYSAARFLAEISNELLLEEYVMKPNLTYDRAKQELESGQRCETQEESYYGDQKPSSISEWISQFDDDWTVYFEEESEYGCGGGQVYTILNAMKHTYHKLTDNEIQERKELIEKYESQPKKVVWRRPIPFLTNVCGTNVSGRYIAEEVDE